MGAGLLGVGAALLARTMFSLLVFGLILGPGLVVLGYGFYRLVRCLRSLPERSLLAELGVHRREVERVQGEMAAMERDVKEIIRVTGATDLQDLQERWLRYGEIGVERKECLREKKRVNETLKKVRDDLRDVEAKVERLKKNTGQTSPETLRKAGQEYEELLQQKEKLESERSGILGDEMREALEDQLREMDKELRQVRLTLEEEGLATFLPTTEEVETWKKKRGDLEVRIKNYGDVKHQCRGKLQGLQEQIQDPEDLRRRIAFIDERLGELDRVHRALEVGVDVLREALTEIQDSYLPLLEEKANGCFRRVVTKDFDAVRLADSWPRITLSSAVKKDILPEELSAGTAEQLYVTLRMACLELLEREEKLPLFIDDSFSNFDPEARERMLAVVEEVATERQILYFTCHPQNRDWIERLRQEGRVPVQEFSWDEKHHIRGK